MRIRQAVRYLTVIAPLDQLLPLLHQNGGFLSSEKGSVRPDSTAWASIILRYSDPDLPVREKALNSLIPYQLKDGRISLSPDYPQSSWPTTLAILAWQNSTTHEVYQNRAVHFLLHSSGKHWKKKPNSVLAHDPTLRGWAWIDNTHSWVETTALGIIALHNAGYETHTRLQEATTMLLDRQLPHGGWNYGNTKVFNTELRPSPEDTGAALSALIGRVPSSDIAHSLDYLITECPRLRTPIALGWSLLGLNAWEQTPLHALEWIEETFSRRHRFGGYDTSSLCLMLAPLVAPQGLKLKTELIQALTIGVENIMETV